MVVGFPKHHNIQYSKVIYEQLRQLITLKLAIPVIELDLCHELRKLCIALVHARADGVQVIMQPK